MHVTQGIRMTAFWRAFWAISFGVLLLMPQTASAQDSPHYLGYKSLTAARLNPLGLVEALTLDYQYRLFKSDNPISKTNFAGVYLQPILSPAYARLGAGIAIQPLSIARIDVRYQYISFFGNFDFMQSFPQAEGADWSDTNLGELSDAETNYGTSGTQLQIGLLLQAKVGQIAVRNQLRVNQYDLDLRDGDTVWYDPLLDALMPGSGWAINDDFDVLYLAHPKFIAGVRYTITTAFYDEEPEDDDNNPIQRIGPLLSYTISQNPGEFVDTMSVFTLIQWHLSHPFRTGEDVSQAVPYFAFGLNVTGSLL